MRRPGTLFLIVGPSGAGKDTLIEAARRRLPRSDYAFPKRTITRPADVNGEDNIAIDRAAFDTAEAAGAFALSWRAHGLCYGIPATIAQDLHIGKSVVVNVSRTVIADARAYHPAVKVVAVTASPNVRTERLRNRGREDAPEIESRAARDIDTPADVTILNDGPLEHAVEAFIAALAIETPASGPYQAHQERFAQETTTMFPVPRSDLKPNTAEFETLPLISPNGFREYDARWLYPKEINLIGVQALGLSLATLIHKMGVAPKIVVGHDYRAYSLSVKQALALGLMSGGAEVLDIGLALSPVAYFAQFALDAPCVAMVTASHNENGWTGVKMGAARPLTFGPDEMTALKEITLAGKGVARAGGSYSAVDGMRAKYLDEVTSGKKLSRPIRVVAACGNGTAGAFVPEALKRIGADVIPLDAELDHTFPRYNPNPEDLKMLHVLSDEVKAHKADVGLAFDGDGDRCGVVDNLGREIFADKAGVLIARDISSRVKNARFVVDVKSTGLFMTDPVLAANGVQTEYWKTGHSYIKRRAHELQAQAGFEKSGHYFFNPPIGRGYDDGTIAAIAVLEMLDRAKGQTMAALYDSLPKTYASPTMAPHCPDEKKYAVVDETIAAYTEAKKRGDKIMDLAIRDLVTVNGVRVTLEDGTWGLVRASSNKPSLVVVVESPVSEERMRGMFKDIDTRLSKNPNVGAYDQRI